MGAAYGSCGERCMAIPLLVAVGDEVGDAVIAGLKTEIAKMKVGPGTDNGNDMGPLVTKPHFEKVKAYVDSGVAEGATLVVDGRGLTRWPAMRKATSWAPACSTTSSPA
jgi:malonate-semialdehyde dehydrogenase (acetylating)/methylmalonate-semialdehyde dehydrogenase